MNTTAFLIGNIYLIIAALTFYILLGGVIRAKMKIDNRHTALDSLLWPIPLVALQGERFWRLGRNRFIRSKRWLKNRRAR